MEEEEGDDWVGIPLWITLSVNRYVIICHYAVGECFEVPESGLLRPTDGRMILSWVAVDRLLAENGLVDRRPTHLSHHQKAQGLHVLLVCWFADRARRLTSTIFPRRATRYCK